MVVKIKLKSDNNKPVPAPPRFSMKDVEELFTEARKDWGAFYEKNEKKFWKANLDIYQWVVFPLITKEDLFYRCILHEKEEVANGVGKPRIISCKNIHFEELLSHCIFYAPDEHKKYIIEKLKLDE